MTVLDPIITGQLAEDLPAADFRRILETFREDLAMLVGRFEANARIGNATECQRIAHSLAGATGAIGALQMEAVAREAMGPGGHAMAHQPQAHQALAHQALAHQALAHQAQRLRQAADAALAALAALMAAPPTA